jgi:transketolase
MSAVLPVTESAATLDQLCVNTLRFLSVDMVQKANSGHPGLPLGAAAMAYVLWTRLLKHNPSNPNWFDRDRFILSAGHGSALLYSLLHLTGYALPLDQIKQFRQWGSMTPGHPERGVTPGVETTTGPLGQGFANGVGMAIAEAHLAARFNRPGFAVINHHTYGIVSDGDLMEGLTSEAASLAGHLQLGKLIYLYDDNHVTLSAATDMCFTEDCARRFDAYGWHTQVVADGNDLISIENALRRARAEISRPSLILVRTHIGFGSPHKQDTFAAHGSPLGVEEVRLTKANLDWPTDPPFYIPEAARIQFSQVALRGNLAEQKWIDAFSAYQHEHAELAEELQRVMHGELITGWDAGIPQFPADTKGISTRVASGKVMNAIAKTVSTLFGGSADLDTSTFTALQGLGDFQGSSFVAGDKQGADSGGWSNAGRNLHFGVREHAMGAIMNGLAAHGGFIPFGATFLVFADYMRPPMRLAALMGLQVVYVFTHDSIAVGEDGSTHQPIEQLASLRAIPDLVVIRPADANETAVAWRFALTSTKQPVALVLTRQDVPTIDRNQYSGADGLALGAYILVDALGCDPDLILIASGSEVALIVAARQKLMQQGLNVRIVSMPSWELFDLQDEQYRNYILPPAIGIRLAVEAGISQGWHRYVGAHGDVLAIDGFGASAPGELVMREYGFTVENVCKRALALMNSSPNIVILNRE